MRCPCTKRRNAPAHALRLEEFARLHIQSRGAKDAPFTANIFGLSFGRMRQDDASRPPRSSARSGCSAAMLPCRTRGSTWGAAPTIDGPKPPFA
jgi:hypothetical protein